MSAAHLEIRTVDLFIESSSVHGRLALLLICFNMNSKSTVNYSIASERYGVKKLPLRRFESSLSSRQGYNAPQPPVLHRSTLAPAPQTSVSGIIYDYHICPPVAGSDRDMRYVGIKFSGICGLTNADTT